MFQGKIEAGRLRANALGGPAASERVIVAIRAGKVISKTALAWALTHVAHPGDSVTFLAIYFGRRAGRMGLWKFPRLGGDCGSSHRKLLPDRISEISESCSQIISQFRDQIEVNVRVKVALAIPAGAVAAEAKSRAASWVILDKKLKQEKKLCMRDLSCNIVVMKGFKPEVMRLNLACLEQPQTPFLSAIASSDLVAGKLQSHKVMYSTPVSSPEVSLSSPDTATPLFLLYDENPHFEGLNKGRYTPIRNFGNSVDSYSAVDVDGKNLMRLLTTFAASAKMNHEGSPRIPQDHVIEEVPVTNQNCSNSSKMKCSTTLLDRFIQFDQDMMKRGLEHDQTQYSGGNIYSSSTQVAVSVSRTTLTPPPLCSLCQHKAPVFGRPLIQFGYEELKEATDGFSAVNFLAEGGFGLVHRGILKDGQVVAVKQLKFAGSQTDTDFCREVRFLSCAQHRNVVLLIGFCIENKRRALVYEYICNGSLDLHLHNLHSRLKIAIGAARGLRYLHEDCRVGCIIHTDMRPSNILLTHDFEPQVSDFGLTRLHSEWVVSAEERVVETSGYLAPEYLAGGKMTEKVDVYAFGMVLIDLIVDKTDCNLQQGNNLIIKGFQLKQPLEARHIKAGGDHMTDKLLVSDQHCDLSSELQALCCAASLCLSQNPELRPPMSKVLRILEGGDSVTALGVLNLSPLDNRSGHMQGLSSTAESERGRNHPRKLSH